MSHPYLLWAIRGEYEHIRWSMDVKERIYLVILGFRVVFPVGEWFSNVKVYLISPFGLLIALVVLPGVEEGGTAVGAD